MIHFCQKWRDLSFTPPLLLGTSRMDMAGSEAGGSQVQYWLSRRRVFRAASILAEPSSRFPGRSPCSQALAAVRGCPILAVSVAIQLAGGIRSKFRGIYREICSIHVNSSSTRATVAGNHGLRFRSQRPLHGKTPALSCNDRLQSLISVTACSRSSPTLSTRTWASSARSAKWSRK